jgi:hypothetical protein
VEGSLGDRLSIGFRSLLDTLGHLSRGFNDHDQRLNDHDRQLKIVLHEIGELQKKVHGLKISRGRAVAAKNRAEVAIEKTKTLLEGIAH